MGCAEVISLDEVRARKHWTTLRQRLHERFERWLDQLESELPAGEPILSQVSETIWALRQQLTGGLAETIVQHTHQEAQSRQHMPCPTCARLLTARGPVSRRVETMVGAVELARPYFYCQVCREGTYPLDDALSLSAGRPSPDNRPRRLQPQCNRPAPAARRAERVARGGRPARPPPSSPAAGGEGRLRGASRGDTGARRGDAGGWARVKSGFIFPILLHHLRLWKKRKEFLDFQSPPIVGSTGLPHHNQVPPILVQDRERLSPDTGCPQCDHMPLDVHFVSSVPVGAGLVPAQPRATTRVAPTLRLAMDL